MTAHLSDTQHFRMKQTAFVAAMAAAVAVEVAGFAGSLPHLGLRRAGAARASRVCMKDDEINTKKVAG